MTKGRLQPLDVAPTALPHEHLRSTVMQLAKPASPSLQPTAVVVPSAATNLSSSTPPTTPFAAMLESHHPAQPPGPTNNNPPPHAKDRTSAQNAAPTKKTQDPNRAPPNERPLDRQLERNRLSALHEARQLTTRSAPVPPSKEPAQDPPRVSRHTLQETAEHEDTAVPVDAGEEDKTPSKTEFDPLTLLQWISDQAAQPALVPHEASASTEVQEATACGTDGGTEQAAPAGGVLSIWHTIKTAAGTSNAVPVVDKTPGARPGLTGKVPLANGLLATPPQTERSQEQPSPDKSSANNLGAGSALTLGALGLEGWSRAMASGTADVPSTLPGAVQKAAPNAGAAEVGGSPQPFALSPGNGNLADTAAVKVNVTAPVQSPEFRALLGSQISLLAKDGVQSAELHLNPAEMGRVSVQITLDGTQARVDFGADSAQTRQFIEASLPELASALRDAGLTLSGGGVSQHAGGRGDQADTHRGSRQGNALPDDPVADTAQRQSISARRVALGGVDLYA
jgi:flagellar hook-length control protein FliK